MILSIVAAALLSIQLPADEAPAPLLFIERIEVRNAKRVSTDVVIAESRLREGNEYSEADLRDASTRLERLPFLLSVDFALEKGSDRGRHVLVLTINETKPFFFLLDSQQTFESGSDYVESDYLGHGASGERLALGFRWFVGRRGAVHVGFAGSASDRQFTRDYASLVLGYTQYDLFGTRAFATINLKKPVEGYGDGALSPQLVVGVPLSPNQTLTLQYDEANFEPDSVRIMDAVFSKQRGQRVVSAKWSYNTTNDPFFPTHGTLLHVIPTAAWHDSGGALSISPDGVISSATHSESYGASAGATQYWELTDRDSISGDVRAEWAQVTGRNDFVPGDHGYTVRYGSVAVGYSRSLWSHERRANGGDSRVEATARFSNRTRRDPSFPDYIYPGRDVRQFGAAWIRRTSWGSLRLGAGYAW